MKRKAYFHTDSLWIYFRGRLCKDEIKSVHSDLEFNLGNHKWATIITNSLSVDEEVRPDNVRRVFRANNGVIYAYVLPCSVKSASICPSQEIRSVKIEMASR